MLDRLAADVVLSLHFAFIAFVVLGAFLVLRWRWIALVHLPASAWGTFVELTGRICPLTVIENRLRAQAGLAGYDGGFIEHYLLRIIYPDGLTREVQFTLAAVVVLVNAAIYGWLLHRLRTPKPRRA